jgi:hypothetical protein
MLQSALQTERFPALGTFSEEALVQSILEKAPSILSVARARILLRREVAVGRTVADVVLLGTSAPTRHLRNSLTVAECVVLAQLRLLGPTRVDLLEKRCGVESREFRDYGLRRLIDMRLVRRQRGGILAAPQSWQRDFRVVAIEAKLVKWRLALTQAIEYKRYADESFVLLPDDVATVAMRSAPLFHDRGIGLIGARRDGTIRVEIAARRTRSHDWQREFVCSRMIGATEFAEPANHQRISRRGVVIEHPALT